MRIARRWFMTARQWGLHYIKAEPPCMKGEIQIGPFVWGWQAVKE
jgi:hypothetical protein